MSLGSLRKQVDKIDGALVKLLNQRAMMSSQIGKLKLKAKKGIYSPDREKQVLQNLAGANKGPLDIEALEAIYREVMSASLALEKDLTIAYLGPQATFTHQAALKKFGASVDYLPVKNISDIFSEGWCRWRIPLRA